MRTGTGGLRQDQSAIFYLQGHPNLDCRILADAAEDRYLSSTGGYVPGDPNIEHPAYVKFDSETGEPVDEYVYVNHDLDGLGIDYTSRQLIAHEEQHHDGWEADHASVGSCVDEEGELT